MKVRMTFAGPWKRITFVIKHAIPVMWRGWLLADLSLHSEKKKVSQENTPGHSTHPILWEQFDRAMEEHNKVFDIFDKTKRKSS